MTEVRKITWRKQLQLIHATGSDQRDSAVGRITPSGRGARGRAGGLDAYLTQQRRVGRCGMGVLLQMAWVVGAFCARRSTCCGVGRRREGLVGAGRVDAR